MSELRTASVADVAGTGPVDLVGQSAAKAYCNFGQKTTQTVYKSLNVSSLTDTGTGNTTLNYTNSFTSADELMVTGSGSGSVGDPSDHSMACVASTSSATLHETYTSSTTLIDTFRASSICMGDLA